MREEKISAVTRIERMQAVFSEALKLPENSFCGSRIELNSNREAVVSDCRGILEYSPETIRLLAGNMTVKFCGRNLVIGSMDRAAAVINGFIVSIEFSSPR